MQQNKKLAADQIQNSEIFIEKQVHLIILNFFPGYITDATLLWNRNRKRFKAFRNKFPASYCFIQAGHN